MFQKFFNALEALSIPFDWEFTEDGYNVFTFPFMYGVVTIDNYSHVFAAEGTCFDDDEPRYWTFDEIFEIIVEIYEDYSE